MARPLRIERAGAWYHVTARGLERRALFRDDKDRLHWLELLAEGAGLWRLVVHAYVLMDNHFHLLLETREPNLSRAMQWLNGSYVIWFNRRHGRAGPLFQGVYKAILVDRLDWGLPLSRYLHLNPVRSGRLGLDKKERIARLRSYRWSSYRAYAGLERAPTWLKGGAVLELNGRGGQAQQQRNYRQYVEEAVREGLKESPWEELKGQMFLGSQQKWEKLRKTIKPGGREQPQWQDLRHRPGFAAVIAVVEVLKDEKWRDFRDRRGDWGRELALYLGRRVGGMRLRALGEKAGGLDYAAVSAAIHRFEGRLKKERKLAQLAQKAESELMKLP